MCVRAGRISTAAGAGVEAPHHSFGQRTAEAWGLIRLFSPLAWTLVFAAFAVASRLIWG